MPSGKVHCTCSSCNGLWVTKETQKKHEKQNAKDVPNMSTWQAANSVVPRPQKRQRTASETGLAHTSGSNDMIVDKNIEIPTGSLPSRSPSLSPPSASQLRLPSQPRSIIHHEEQISSRFPSPITTRTPDLDEGDDLDPDEIIIALEMAREIAERTRAAQEDRLALEGMEQAARARANIGGGGGDEGNGGEGEGGNGNGNGAGRGDGDGGRDTGRDAGDAGGDAGDAGLGGDSQGPPDEEDDIPFSRLENIQITQEFTRLIQSATYENGNLTAAQISRLRNPPENVVEVLDAGTRYSLDLFLAITNSAEETYTKVRNAALRFHPEDTILSYYEVKKLVEEMTGVVGVSDDMCINSCLAFVGPYQNDETCRECGEQRYDQGAKKRVPRQQFGSTLLGFIIQAIRRTPIGSLAMHYLKRKMEDIKELVQSLDPQLGGKDMVYDDLLSGSQFWDLVDQYSITGDDSVIGLSIDGLQLYQNKKSDTWLFIWVIYSIHPETRYKQKFIFPGGVINGPNKPKVLDSFLFRSLHHISAIQREKDGKGLRVWDATERRSFDSKTIFALGTADAVGMPDLDGRVGHHGAHGCRLGCPMKGRHKPGVGHYYAPHLLPHDYPVEDCNHPDIDIRDLPILSPARYKQDIQSILTAPDLPRYKEERKRTGLSKPTLLSGLLESQSIPVPSCFCLDMMHLTKINIEDLLISLWRGTISCDPTDSKADWPWRVLTGQQWKEHGQAIAEAGRYFPSSFHRPPRNPAQKISSGYKATEYYHYVFGLGPAHFRKYLPREYWLNFCKLARAIRISLRRQITGADIQEAHTLMIQFVEEYELLYYQRRHDRIHICRPSIHTCLHVASEIMRVGPGAYSTQFTIERTIGDLGREVRQPSNPFANLSRRALRRSQTNIIKLMCPELDPPKPRPRGSLILPNGFLLLRARDRYPTLIEGLSYDAIKMVVHRPKLHRWARLRLSNGQILRCLWKEKERKTTKPWKIGRNAKAMIDGKLEICEAQFFFVTGTHEAGFDGYALVSVYSRPDMELWNDSSKTLWACTYRGDANLRAIPVSDILECISMQPLPPLPGEPVDRWFTLEKSGLDDGVLNGEVEEDEEEV